MFECNLLYEKKKDGIKAVDMEIGGYGKPKMTQKEIADERVMFEQ